MRPNFLARPALSASMFVASRPSGASLRRSVWRSVVRLSAAGEGVFTVYRRTSQPLFSEIVIFFTRNSIFLCFHTLVFSMFCADCIYRNFIARDPGPKPAFQTYPQTRTRDSRRFPRFRPVNRPVCRRIRSLIHLTKPTRIQDSCISDRISLESPALALHFRRRIQSTLRFLPAREAGRLRLSRFRFAVPCLRARFAVFENGHG